MEKNISKLQFITNNTTNSHIEVLEKACIGGIDWVQLRVKNVSEQKYIFEAKKAKNICANYNVKLIINDNVVVAKTVNADGVHLGKNDMSPQKAREILGEKFIIGATANTIDDIICLSKMPIDYIGLGPYRFTTTKKKLSPVLCVDGYNKIFEQLPNNFSIPIIAIGGIEIEDIKPLMQTKISGIAFSGMLTKSDNYKKTIDLAITNAINGN